MYANLPFLFLFPQIFLTMLSLFIQLAEDDSPMVRRAAAKALVVKSSNKKKKGKFTMQLLIFQYILEPCQSSF